MRTRLFPILICLFLAAPLSGTAQAQSDVASLTEKLKTYHYGDSPAVLDALAQQVAEARSKPDRSRQVARDLAEVLRSDASFDAKQFACRQLVYVASEEQVPVLIRLLQDEGLAHYALMALTRIPGKAVDDALLQELPRSHGRPELEILDILADRGDVLAMSAFMVRLRSTDPVVLEGAASALAKLADPRAARALRETYMRSSGASRVAVGHALLDCAARLQKRGDLTTALALYDLLGRDPESPVLRAAALRGIVQVRGEKALPLLLAALREDGTRRQTVAADLVREIRGREATQRLSSSLPKLTAKGQILLMEALGDRGDAAAAPAVIALCRSSDPAVRVTALSALGSLGSAATVSLLLTSASSGSPPERAAARDSLARLRGESVDKALLGALETGAPALRAEAIRSLGQRRATAAVPLLLKEARSPQREVSIAALRVLRDLGQPSLLPQLVDLLLAAPSGARDEAMDAVTEIARRSPDESQRTGVLLARLSTASKPADRVALLTIVGQVGGSQALNALRTAVADPDAEVRMTALSVLAEWPTDAPMDALLRTVRAAQEGRERTIALRGYLRMIGVNEQRTPEQALALYREVAALTTHPEEKRLVLAGLAKVRSREALEYASGFLTDGDVRAEAELAVVEIGRSTIGAWRDRTRALLEPIAREGNNEEVRKRAAEVLAVSDRFGDYVMAWEVSPVYQRDGADFSRLFDIPFPPEEDGQDKEVPWRLMPVGGTSDQPWLLDLLALWGGEQRVAYLRSAVWSEGARDLVLEMGSDDGLKVWWNGQVVLAHNVARAVAPGQEKVKVQLHPGWNRLLLKVTQNVLGWGACARFTNPDGSPAAGLRFAAPSSVDSVDKER
jgi:HEAT repeat protein